MEKAFGTRQHADIVFSSSSCSSGCFFFPQAVDGLCRGVRIGQAVGTDAFSGSKQHGYLHGDLRLAEAWPW